MMTDMLLEYRAVEPFYKNGFLLGCEATRQAVLIDPGDEVAQLLALVETQHLTIRYILLTHAHMDHVSGVAEAKRATGATIALHHDDLFLYQAAVQQGLMFGYRLEAPPPVDQFYEPGLLSFGNYVVRVHHTPGHSPGGVCLQVGPLGHEGAQLFVGDTLFAGSIGRTDLPGGNLDTLLQSIRTVLYGFGDAAEVYPGHGPTTTIGQERRTNPFLNEL
jgi:hydroxyacylglutathione hydrolase